MSVNRNVTVPTGSASALSRSSAIPIIPFPTAFEGHQKRGPIRSSHGCAISGRAPLSDPSTITPVGKPWESQHPDYAAFSGCERLFDSSHQKTENAANTQLFA
jgi:hypothetical protein